MNAPIAHEELVKTFGKPKEEPKNPEPEKTDGNPEGKVEPAKTDPVVDKEPEKKDDKEEGKTPEDKKEPEKTNVDPDKKDGDPNEEDDVEAFMKAEYGDTAKPAEVKADEKATDVKADEKKEPIVDERIQALEKLLEDPFIAYALQAKAQGKDIAADLAAIAKEDPSTLPDERLYTMLLEREGITGEKAEESLERYRDKDELDKKLAVKAFRQELINERASKMELLKPKEVVDNFAPIVEAAQTRLAELKTEKVGQTLDGMELTEERVAEISKYTNEQAPQILKPDGTFDVDAMFEYSAWKLYNKEIIKSNITKYRNMERERLLKERTNPNGNTGGGKAFVKSSGNGIDDAINAMRN